MKHPYYPSPELPRHVESYAQGLVDHAADYGSVTANSPKELAPVVKLAQDLEGAAKEIEDLQLELAAKLEAFHKAAWPLWTQFSEKLGYAETYAKKNGKGALLNFLKTYQHHVEHHAAAKAAGAAPVAAAK